MSKSASFILPCLALLLAASLAAATPTATLDADYSRLLALYVHDHLVDYDGWAANADNKAALGQYVDRMAALDPADWPRDEALAYWLNLYNAVTLRLVLDNYPLESIKDIGGFMKKSPWKRRLVTVADNSLTLNNIENDIIRPTFAEPRVHFALNCASLGCPPLTQSAFAAEQLSDQLDAACRLALNQDRWVKVDGDKVQLTKIFDWYSADFEVDGGSVLAFIRRFRTEPFPDGQPKVSFMSYDWQLNRVPAANPSHDHGDN